MAAIKAAVAEYSGILSDPVVLRLYLTTGRGAPATPLGAGLNAGMIQVFAALMQLDEWLAANAPTPPAVPPFSVPDIADLNRELTSLALDSSSSSWQSLFRFLSELYYLALLFSAFGVYYSLTEVLGLLTRWLLVMDLVDDTQEAPSPIKTPDDVDAALRWRTLVLPEKVTSALSAIRARREAVIVRKPGFADLYITREEWDHYEAAEIAAIENILGRELKNRVHVLLNETTVTTTTEVVTSSLREQDSTTTDLSQLQQQSSSDISIAAHIDGKVDTSGQYGPTLVNTHLGGSLDFSDNSATSKAATQSHETVSRSVSRIEQTTRQVRTISTLTRATDTEEHKFDNRQQTAPVVGIYRWVDQIQNVELDRYPHRFLMEFELPEPGAWMRWLQNQNAGQGMINKPPVPLTTDGSPVSDINPMLIANDISGDPKDSNYYEKFTARYAAPGITPPPGPLTVAVNLGDATDNGEAKRFLVANAADTNFSPPSGYRVGVDAKNNNYSWTASLMYASGGYQAKDDFTDVHVDVSVGGGPPVRSAGTDNQDNPGTATPTTGGVYRDQISGKAGPISQAAIPVTVQGTNLTGFEVNIEVYCVPLDQTYQRWQSDTYDAIVAAYYGMLQAYNQEKSGLTVQQTNPVDMNPPAQNAQAINQELKRQIIEMLIGMRFSGRNAISWDVKGVNAPTTDLSLAARFAPEIQFLEQAFEWETMSYICYPYYWAESDRWKDLAVITGDDSNFADFLRAGSARVVLAARPGFENQVNFYVSYGILWGAGPMPAAGDPDYLSIADEIKAAQQRPIDVTVIDTWQVRLPTTLIWLENIDGLPKNKHPTIDTTPRIVSLSTPSGTTGDTVTIAGRNFGDIQGNSMVAFNGTDATPSKWSATSIEATVPAGATTGPVTVTVNGVVSNGVTFTVN
jgi:hypothetical protein